MSENLENRISSEQAKDAIFKIHSVQSSASEIDAVANVIKNIDFTDKNTYTNETIVDGINGQNINTNTILDFTKSFTVSFVFENLGNTPTYTENYCGMRNVDGTYFRIGYFRDSNLNRAYAVLRVNSTNYTVSVDIKNKVVNNLVFTNIAETREISITVDGVVIERANYPTVPTFTYPLFIGKYNNTGTVSGNGLKMSNIAIFPFALNNRQLDTTFKFFDVLWNKNTFLKLNGYYTFNEMYVNIFKNLEFKLSNKDNNLFLKNKLVMSKNICYIGDSISHGAFSSNIKKKSHVNLFKNYLNNLGNTLNFGFETSADSLGVDYKTLFHQVTSSGMSLNSVESDFSPNGSSLSGNTGSSITFTVSELLNQNKFRVAYIPNTDTMFTCNIYVNNVLKGTDTINSNINKNYVQGNIYDLETDNTEIRVEIASGTGTVHGVYYYVNEEDVVVNNFSQGGRKIRDVKDSIIDDLCAKNNAILWALGHNDQDSNEVDKNIVYGKLDRLIAKAIENKTIIVFLDFIWLKNESNIIKSKFKSLANSNPKICLYVNFNENLTVNGSVPTSSYLVNDLKSFVDAAHPNDLGHKYIFVNLKKVLEN